MGLPRARRPPASRMALPLPGVGVGVRVEVCVWSLGVTCIVAACLPLPWMVKPDPQGIASVSKSQTFSKIERGGDAPLLAHAALAAKRFQTWFGPSLCPVV